MDKCKRCGKELMSDEVKSFVDGNGNKIILCERCLYELQAEKRRKMIDTANARLNEVKEGKDTPVDGKITGSAKGIELEELTSQIGQMKKNIRFLQILSIVLSAITAAIIIILVLHFV